MGRRHRSWGPPFTKDFEGRTSLLLLSCRGKQIVGMNLKNRRGTTTFDSDDIIVENFRPARSITSSKVAEDKILCSISGYGATKPKLWPGYDLSLQLDRGLCLSQGKMVTTSKSRGSVDRCDNRTPSHIRHNRALFTERTGLGLAYRHQFMGLRDCSPCQSAQSRITGEDPRPMASAHPNLVPYRAFEASDGWFVIAIGSDDQWRRTSGALGCRTTSNGKKMRIGSVDPISNLFSGHFHPRARDHWEQKLSGLPSQPSTRWSSAGR